MNETLSIVGVSAPTFPIGSFKDKIEWLSDFLTKTDVFKRADIIVLPELFTIGYPPGDVLYDPYTYEQQRQFLREIENLSYNLNTSFLFGGYQIDRTGRLYNVACFTYPGHKTLTVHEKIHLPNYNIFSEKRYFSPGRRVSILEVNNFKLGVLICEDLWVPSTVESLVTEGVDIIVSLNASPYTKGKTNKVARMLAHKSWLYGTPILYVNWFGGRDELIYISPSFYAQDGEIYETVELQGASILAVTLDPSITLKRTFRKVKDKRLVEMVDTYPVSHTRVELYLKNSKLSVKKKFSKRNDQELIDALALGIAQYFKDSKCDTAILGVSGGIDSAVVLCLLDYASRIYGYPKRIIGFFMPSQFTSQDSYTAFNLLSEKFSNRVNVELRTVKLPELFNLESLDDKFEDIKLNKLAKENYQARVRGLYLATVSNAIQGSLVVACGNKTEYALGYATLYGDMVGGIAPLKDVWKTEVFKLARLLGVPEFIIKRKASAELSDGQFDEDEFGLSYEKIDSILKRAVEDVELENNEIVKRMLKQEFKRRQGPIGFKVSEFSFESDRIFPIHVNL